MPEMDYNPLWNEVYKTLKTRESALILSAHAADLLGTDRLSRFEVEESFHLVASAGLIHEFVNVISAYKWELIIRKKPVRDA